MSHIAEALSTRKDEALAISHESVIEDEVGFEIRELNRRMELRRCCLSRLSSGGKNVQLCIGVDPAGSPVSNLERCRRNIYERIEDLVRRNRAFR